jgi:hypothetical protein
MNNPSIPSTHAERQITDLSVKHAFTLYPSLSPYSQTESLTEEQIHLLRVGWRNLLVQLFCCVRFWFWREIGLGFTYLHMLLNKLFYELIFSNSCAICMQLLPYFSYSCMNILCLSCVHLPLFILLNGKLVGTSFSDPKETGRHKQQIAMRSNCYAQQPMECSTDEE